MSSDLQKIIRDAVSYLESDYAIDTSKAPFLGTSSLWESRKVSLIDLPKQVLVWGSIGAGYGICIFLEIIMTVKAAVKSCAYGLVWGCQEISYQLSIFNLKNQEWKILSCENWEECKNSVNESLHSLGMIAGVIAVGILFSGGNALGVIYPEIGRQTRHLYKESTKHMFDEIKQFLTTHLGISFNHLQDLKKALEKHNLAPIPEDLPAAINYLKRDLRLAVHPDHHPEMAGAAQEILQLISPALDLLKEQQRLSQVIEVE